MNGVDVPMIAVGLAVRVRRWVWCAVVVAVLGGALALPGRAGASVDLAEVEVTRYGGADRFETSLLVAREIAQLEGGRLGVIRTGFRAGSKDWSEHGIYGHTNRPGGDVASVFG